MIYHSNSLVTNNLTSFGIKFYWFVMIIKAIAVRYTGATVSQTIIVVANNTHANTYKISIIDYLHKYHTEDGVILSDDLVTQT